MQVCWVHVESFCRLGDDPSYPIGQASELQHSLYNGESSEELFTCVVCCGADLQGIHRGCSRSMGRKHGHTLLRYEQAAI